MQVSGISQTGTRQDSVGMQMMTRRQVWVENLNMSCLVRAWRQFEYSPGELRCWREAEACRWRPSCGHYAIKTRCMNKSASTKREGRKERGDSSRVNELFWEAGEDKRYSFTNIP